MTKIHSITVNESGEIVCSIKEMQDDIAVFLTHKENTYVTGAMAYSLFVSLYNTHCNPPTNARKTPTGKIGKWDKAISRRQFIKICNLLHPDRRAKQAKLFCDEPKDLITELSFYFEEERPREVTIGNFKSKQKTFPRVKRPPVWELEKCFIDGLRAIREARNAGADYNDETISQGVFNMVMFRAPNFLSGGKAA